MIEDALYARILTWEDAQSIAGSTMEFKPDDDADTWVPIALESVQERKTAPGTHQFSLFFRSPHEPNFAQATYRFRHPSLGEYAIFMTPIERNAQGVLYQAVFARAD